MKTYFNVGTFNVRTLKSEIRLDQLSQDIENYKLDVLCLQQTKIQNGADRTTNSGRLICFPSDSRFYGCGFFINNRWKDSIHKTWKVSDRLCVLQLHGDVKPNNKQGKNSISIINVYAPTKERAEKHPDEFNKFYKDLNKTIDELGNRTLLIIAGDFNAKVGKREEGDSCLGAYSKGKRNENGEHLVELCEDRKLFVTNSAFNHAARHQTTWIGQRKDKKTGSIINIYNQIDYILCRQRHKRFTTNSRSYAGTLLTTDHKLVKTNFVIEWHKQIRQHDTGNNEPKINIANIVNNSQCRKQYQRLLDTRLELLHNENNTANESWSSIREAITTTATQTAGTTTRQRTRRPYDETTAELSRKQKELRIKIQNSKQEEEQQKLKRERNKILHRIRERVITLRNEELEKKVDNINQCNNDQAMYKAVRLLNQKPFENPKVEDEKGKLITDPNATVKLLSNFYRRKFTNKDSEPISSFEGKPRPLSKPITHKEVRLAVKNLNNNRAPGEDGLCAELLKYGPPQLDEHIADIFNKTFQNHQSLDINKGNLIALPKPGKTKGPPQNLRPITLLNTIRKTLSIITLHRIRPFIENYIAHSQSGFRPERSTADVVWAHKWLAAKTISEKIDITITGIDMSAAFDTINREALLKILQDIVLEDEMRLIRFLISETWITTKVNGATKEFPFLSNVGTPQGDSLSPILFIVYLEHALQDLRKALPQTLSNFETELPREISYADDIDFIGLTQVDITLIKNTLQQHHLYVNAEKTDVTLLSRSQEGWRSTKKVGSLIGDKEDVERRKKLSTVALKKLMNVWISNDKIKINVKIKLYTSLVKSVLIYNCGTWALTRSEEEKLDRFHRKQLKKVLNIRYPTKITNTALYKKCNERPLSLQILEARWRLFGHILRRDKEIPANIAMNTYFTPSGQGKHKGRPPTTIYTVLNRDLKHLRGVYKLESKEDLLSLRSSAEDRDKWKDITQRIREAAEASRSDD